MISDKLQRPTTGQQANRKNARLQPQLYSTNDTDADASVNANANASLTLRLAANIFTNSSSSSSMRLLARWLGK